MRSIKELLVWCIKQYMQPIGNGYDVKAHFHRFIATVTLMVAWTVLCIAVAG